MYTMHQVLGVHSVPSTDLATQNFKKETKRTVGPFHSGYIDIHTVKNWQKLHKFTGRCEYFTIGREIKMLLMVFYM